MILQSPSWHLCGENQNFKRYMHPSVHCGTMYNSQDMEATYMSADRWMNKKDVVHIYRGVSLSHKKEWNKDICSNMEGPRDYFTKWSMKTRKIKYHMLSHKWGISNMIEMNLFTKQNKNHRHRKHMYGYQRGKRGKDKSGGRAEHTYTIMYKTDNQQDLLYSTGNSQYSVIT